MLCGYTHPKFYSPSAAYGLVRETLSKMFPFVDSEIGLNGLWTPHLVLLLRRLLDEPTISAASRRPTVPVYSSQHNGLVIEDSLDQEEEEEGTDDDNPSSGDRAPTVRTEEEELAVVRPTPRGPLLRNVETPSASIQLSFFTTFAGVNPDHGDVAYYNEGGSFNRDCERVEAAMAAIRNSSVTSNSSGVGGIQLQVSRLSTEDMVEMLQDEDGEQELVFICLVDATKLRCRCRMVEQRPTWVESAWSWMGYDTERPYLGHYVVLCGYDAVTNQVMYRNPAVGESEEQPGSGWLCAESVASFEEARASKGTDFDTLMLRLC